MTPFYSDDWLTLYGGDCRAVLSELPADSVDCVVTSPPYWGLRDYGSDSQLGLERTPEEYVANLVAVFAEVRRVLKPSGTCWLNLGDSYAATTKHGGMSSSTGLRPFATKFGKAIDEDAKGTRRVDIGGLKPKDLVGIPWRVAFALQADGWYLRSDIIWSKPNPMPESVTDRPTKAHEYLFLMTKSPRYYFDQEAVRESTQQGSEASLRAVREGQGNGQAVSDFGGWESSGASVLLHGQGQSSDGPLPAVGEREGVAGEGSSQAPSGHANREHSNGRGVGDDQGVGSLPVLRAGEAVDDGSPSSDLEGWSAHSGERGGRVPELQQQAGQSGRNLRSVWTIATRPYPGAHFAVFPPELPERCIKAGSSERGVCPECGAPWERVVERRESLARTTGDGWQEGRSEQIASGRRGRSRPGSFTSVPVKPPYVPPSEIDRYGTGEAGVHRKVGGQYQKWLDANPAQTTGWLATCEHTSSTPAPAVILDPFAGSGTVGMVANRLSRRAILIDLNPEYLKQQMKRNAQTPLGLAG